MESGYHVLLLLYYLYCINGKYRVYQKMKNEGDEAAQ
jgi:hypothetical protein